MSKREPDESLADIEIDYVNKKRNIPFHLSPAEELLYGYTQGVTLKELEGMREQYVNQLGDEVGLPSL